MRKSKVFQGPFTALAAGVVLCAFCGCSQPTSAPAAPAAQGAPGALAIGGVMPDFELKDVSGTTHTLKQHSGSVVVLEMCSIECPWSRGTDPHLVELSQKYAPNGVVFLGIDSHNTVSVDQIKEYAAKNGKTYPILKDVDNKYADLLGAKTTPEVFIVDKDGKLAYHGAFDDRAKETEKGATPYVDNALTAILAGKPADPSETKSWGCSIKRK